MFHQHRRRLRLYFQLCGCQFLQRGRTTTFAGGCPFVLVFARMMGPGGLNTNLTPLPHYFVAQHRHETIWWSSLSLSVAVITTNKGPSRIWPANTKVVREGKSVRDKRGAASSAHATSRGPLIAPRALIANAIVSDCGPLQASPLPPS